MNLRIKSADGHLINDTTNYEAADLRKDLLPPTQTHYVANDSTYERYAGMSFGHGTMPLGIVIQGDDFHALKAQLQEWFGYQRDEPKELIAEDLDDGNREWFLMYVASSLIEEEDGTIVAVLDLQEPYWRPKDGGQSQDWDITASGQTVDINVGGNVEALPVFEVTVTQAKTGGFAYRDWCRVYNPNSEAVLNEMVDITNGGIDTATLVLAGKMQADGDDVRVYDGGQEVDRVIVGMNGPNTKIFAGPFNFAAKVEMAMQGAIAGAGSVTAIYVKNTTADIAMLKKLPNQRGIIEIDNERYIYTGTNVAARRIDIAERAVRKSVMAAHADGAIIKWLEHDPWLYYGNSVLGAPTTDPNHEPAYDVATSTNANRVYTSFGDKAGLRPGAWRTAILKRAGLESTIYSGDHGDETADPMTELGMAIKSFLKAGKWTAETAILQCKFSHPGGITSVTVTGEKRRTSTSGTPTWPATMALRKSKDGKTYINQFNEAAPAPSASYSSLTNTGLQNLGAGYKHIDFLASGSMNAVPDGEADLEINGVTVVITNPITASLQGEEDHYDLNCEIQNETMQQSLFLHWTMGLNETLTADSEQRIVTHSDGTNAYRAKRLDAPRLEWLPFKPGVVNRLKFIDLGTTGVTVRVKHEERGW